MRQESVVFSRACLLWMLFGQLSCLVPLYALDPDAWDNPASAPVLSHLGRDLPSLALIGAFALFAIGTILVAMGLVRERGAGPSTARSLSGILYLLVGLVCGALILQSMPDPYCPPPRFPQFAWVGAVIALDITCGLAIRRFIRSRNPAGP